MTQLASDNFNRVSDPLNTNWTDTAFGSKHWTTDGSIAVPSNLGGDANALYSGGAISWPNDQYSEAKVTVVGDAGAGDDPGIGVCVRMAGDASANFYRAVVDGATPAHYTIDKVIAGVRTSLKTGTVSRSAGDVLRLEIAGTTMTLKNAGTTVTTQTDASLASGKPGIGSSAVAGGISSGSVDDWAGGDLSAGAASFVISPTAVPANNTNPIAMTLIGTNTTWNSSTAFSVSGAATYTGVKNFINATSYQVLVTTGAGVGTATITDTTDSIAATFQVGNVGGGGFGGAGLSRGMD